MAFLGCLHTMIKNDFRGNFMKKPTLCVIFGGKSQEYEISLRSAYAVLSNLDTEKYNVVTLGITRKGEWYIYEGEKEKILTDCWQEGADSVTMDLTTGRLIVMEKSQYEIEVDLFFPVLHGQFGEDGRLQALFELARVKYIGTPSFSSHICMDKGLTKDKARAIGVPVAKELGQETEGLDFPVFVKPKMSGSSIGATRVSSKENLEGAIKEAQKYGEFLIEEYIDGYEVEVGVIQTSDRVIVSGSGMIKYKGEFYDYFAKYKSQDNRYMIPSPIDEGAEKAIRKMARELFFSLGCRGLARFDFFVKKDGGVIFNEVNTLPGFTEGSMFPKLFTKMGISFTELLDKVIEYGLLQNI